MIIQIIEGEMLAERLQNLSRGAAGKVVRGILAEGVGPMVPAMRSRIHSVTGLLAGGLRLKMGKGDRPGKYSVYVDSAATARKFESTKHRPVAAGSAGRQYRVYYGIMVEFGHKYRHDDETSTHIDKRGEARGEHGPIYVRHGQAGRRTPAHSFLRAVFDAQAEGAAEKIENSFWELVEQNI
jgi:hypothetical protein